jgi:hypothetical protein
MKIIIWVWHLTYVVLATQEDDIGRITVQGQPGKKFLQDPISTNKSWVWCCTYHSSSEGSVNRRIAL